MNMCANHPESPAAAYCRMCGKPLCELCRVDSMGAIYCAEHLPVAHSQDIPPAPAYDPRFSGAAGWDTPPPPPQNVPSPYTAASAHASPALALILGTIPGVGAIYNGQYAKGLIHAVVFGLLVTIVSHGGSPAPLVGILIGVWWFYMVLEAFHTARKRKLGLPVDELSSIVNFQTGRRSRFPIGAVVLIALGMLLLLDTTGLIPLDRLRNYWPIGLILLGVYMLYARMERTPEPIVNQEFSDERR